MTERPVFLASREAYLSPLRERDRVRGLLGQNYLFPKTMASRAIRTKTPFLICLK
jgi:hypothetical protein